MISPDGGILSELAELIRSALDRGDVAEVIKSRLSPEQRTDLEKETFEQSGDFLQFTRREVEELHKAQSSLYEHEGRRPPREPASPTLNNLRTSSLRTETSKLTYTFKNAPAVGLIHASAANLLGFGIAALIWLMRDIEPGIGWPWKLGVAVTAQVLAIIAAAALMLAGDRWIASHQITSLPRRRFDGGIRRLVFALLPAGVGLWLTMLYAFAFKRSWSPPGAHSVGAGILWGIGAAAILLVLAAIFAATMSVLRSLILGPAVASTGIVLIYLILLAEFLTFTTMELGTYWSTGVWFFAGLIVLTVTWVGVRSALNGTRLTSQRDPTRNPDQNLHGEQMPASSPVMRATAPTAIDASIPIGQWRRQRQALEDAADQALKRWRVAVTENAILPFLRLWVNRNLNPYFDRRFDVFDATGLYQARAARHLVETAALSRFGPLLRRLDGGAVALVGPRGAGKSTIIQALADGRWLGSAERVLLLAEDAPLEYQPREFALHLYSRLCQEVIDLTDSAVDRPAPGLMPRRLVRYAAARRRRHAQASGGRDPRPTTMSQLVEQAQRRLEQIKYLQTYTVGWSGALNTGGIQASSNRSVELSRQTMSHPEVVHAFHDFLSRTVEVLGRIYGTSPAPVIIAIDELDRLPSEQSANFIREIKGLLSPQLAGCLYVMAISDQASDPKAIAGSSEFFLNSFDAIVQVEFLPLAASIELIRTRAIGLPDPFLWLCHCITGGLPRELIRIARSVVDIGQQDNALDGACRQDIADISRMLVSSELARSPGLMRAMAALTDNPLTAQFLMLGRSVSAEPPDAEQIILGILDVLGSDAADDYQKLRKISADFPILICRLYHSATILQLFSACEPVDDFLRKAYESGEQLLNLDKLATAIPLISVDPRLSWLTISSVRRVWNLNVYDMPGSLEADRPSWGAD